MNTAARNWRNSLNRFIFLRLVIIVLAKNETVQSVKNSIEYLNMLIILPKN